MIQSDLKVSIFDTGSLSAVTRCCPIRKHCLGLHPSGSNGNNGIAHRRRPHCSLDPCSTAVGRECYVMQSKLSKMCEESYPLDDVKVGVLLFTK